VGLPAPEILAPIVATVEIVGDALLLLGVFSRWVALYFVFHFLVIAFVVKLPRTGWDASRIDLMMLAAAILVLLAGPGMLALDEMLARRRAEPARAT
jgi:putative oxidoreductase